MDDHQDLYHQQQLEQQQFEEELDELESKIRRSSIYTDRFAEAIKSALNRYDPEKIIAGCGAVQLDRHPEYGYLVSAKKTLFAVDMNGRHYKITVEDV